MFTQNTGPLNIQHLQFVKNLDYSIPAKEFDCWYQVPNKNLKDKSSAAFLSWLEIGGIQYVPKFEDIFKLLESLKQLNYIINPITEQEYNDAKASYGILQSIAIDYWSEYIAHGYEKKNLDFLCQEEIENHARWEEKNQAGEGPIDKYQPTFEMKYYSYLRNYFQTKFLPHYKVSQEPRQYLCFFTDKKHGGMFSSIDEQTLKP